MKVLKQCFIDLSNKKFGHLTVISKSKIKRKGRTLWKCKCKCGRIKCVMGKNLLNGNTKSCGCLQREYARTTALDLTGQIFGRLKVIRKITTMYRYVEISRKYLRNNSNKCTE